MSSIRRASAVAIGICLVPPAIAQQKTSTELAPVVVTATRTPQRVSEVTSDVTVITREEIEKSGQSSLAEILQRQPGIQVTTSGGLGSNASVFVRGTNSDHVLVLVDGLRMNSATAGAAAFQHIPPSQIERIEILRGPASSLYGADAIGGVIQIFTRSADGPPKLRASAGYGSFRTEEYTAGFGGKVGDTTFNVDAGYLESRSFSAARPTSPFYNRDRDPYRNSNLSMRLSHKLSIDHEVGATFFGSEGRTHFDSFPASFDHVLNQTLMAYQFYTRNRFLPTWLSTLRIGHSRDDTTSYSAVIPSIFRTDQQQASWQHDVTTGFGDILFGAEQVRQKVAGTTPYPVTSRTISSLLAGYTARYREHSLQANVRRDFNSQFGNHTTGSVSYGYAFTPSLRASAAYGTAFKSPSFNQLYFPGFGNPNLRPESSENIEAALRYNAGGHSAGVVAYRNLVRDLIVNVPIPGGGGFLMPANVNVADLKGVTLTYGYDFAGWSLRASGDIVSPRDDIADKMLPRRAMRHGTLSVARNMGPWSTGVEVFASDYRYDDTANLNRLGGYALLNAFASYRFAPGWSIIARVNNLLDKDYELVRTFETTGFNAFVAVRYEPR